MTFGVSEIFLLASGLILLGAELHRVPKVGKDLQKFSSWLSGFGVFIGLINLLLVFLAILR